MKWQWFHLQGWWPWLAKLWNGNSIKVGCKWPFEFLLWKAFFFWVSLTVIMFCCFSLSTNFCDIPSCECGQRSIENSLSQKWDVMTFLNAVYASLILIKKNLLAWLEIQILELFDSSLSFPTSREALSSHSSWWGGLSGILNGTPVGLQDFYHPVHSLIFSKVLQQSRLMRKKFIQQCWATLLKYMPLHLIYPLESCCFGGAPNITADFLWYWG